MLIQNESKGHALSRCNETPLGNEVKKSSTSGKTPAKNKAKKHSQIGVKPANEEKDNESKGHAPSRHNETRLDNEVKKSSTSGKTPAKNKAKKHSQIGVKPATEEKDLKKLRNLFRTVSLLYAEVFHQLRESLKKNQLQTTTDIYLGFFNNVAKTFEESIESSQTIQKTVTLALKRLRISLFLLAALPEEFLDDVNALTRFLLQKNVASLTADLTKTDPNHKKQHIWIYSLLNYFRERKDFAVSLGDFLDKIDPNTVKSSLKTKLMRDWYPTQLCPRKILHLGPKIIIWLQRIIEQLKLLKQEEYFAKLPKNCGTLAGELWNKARHTDASIFPSFMRYCAQAFSTLQEYRINTTAGVKAPPSSLHASFCTRQIIARTLPFPIETIFLYFREIGYVHELLVIYVAYLLTHLTKEEIFLKIIEEQNKEHAQFFKTLQENRKKFALMKPELAKYDAYKRTFAFTLTAASISAKWACLSRKFLSYILKEDPSSDNFTKELDTISKKPVFWVELPFWSVFKQFQSQATSQEEGKSSPLIGNVADDFDIMLTESKYKPLFDFWTEDLKNSPEKKRPT
ncbi:MAG: hypothetical protein AAGI90_03290 [Chlamydiota bacterium]